MLLRVWQLIASVGFSAVDLTTVENPCSAKTFRDFKIMLCKRRIPERSFEPFSFQNVYLFPMLCVCCLFMGKYILVLAVSAD